MQCPGAFVYKVLDSLEDGIEDAVNYEGLYAWTHVDFTESV